MSFVLGLLNTGFECSFEKTSVLGLLHTGFERSVRQERILCWRVI